jgi:hypothetical protein
MLLGFFHVSTRLFHCSLLMHLSGEVLVTICSGKGSKYVCFSLYHCWRTTVFIISIQAFLTITSYMFISNLAYSDGRACYRLEVRLKICISKEENVLTWILATHRSNNACWFLYSLQFMSTGIWFLTAMLQSVANFTAIIGTTGLIIPSGMTTGSLPRWARVNLWRPCPIFTPRSRHSSPSYKCILPTQLAALKIGTSKAICNMVNR